MLKKLRIKLVVTTMVLITLVLSIAFGVIIYSSYARAESEVNAALESALTSDRADFHFRLDPFTQEDGAVTVTPLPDGSQSGGAVGDSRIQRGEASGGLHYIACSSYLLASDGSYTVLKEQITISDVSGAISTASDPTRNTSGRLSQFDLYYRVDRGPEGTKVAFSSTDYVDNTVRSLSLTLAAVGACLLIVFFLLSLLFSRWATKPVERAWIQQQNFVADASHELKTPLTVVLANNSILMDHADESVASQMQWVESTQTEAKLMQGLVDDLLVLAKPENTDTKLQYPQIDFSDLVEKSSLVFESVAFEKGIDIVADVSAGCTLQGDETRLGRLVGVLIDNACKYAGEKGRVSVALDYTDSHATLTVNNTGTHIAAEDLPHIFDRFYRADKARVRTEGGFGLGLAIAKEICDEHKGTIDVTSGESHGTTFTVTLPRNRR